MPHFLGVDVGTTNVKAVVVDEDQRVIASASRRLLILRPASGRFEQHPQSWWSAFRRVCADLRNQAPKPWQDIAAIGLTGQMHGAVCLDSSGRALRPAILWNDGRARAECKELAQKVPAIRDIAGVIPMAGFTAPKLLWLQHHEPQLFKRISHVVLAKDFVRLKLCGDYATDMSDAAGALLLDEAARQWSEPLVAASGLSPRQMPRLAEGDTIAGRVRSAMAAALGLKCHVIVAAGGGDVAVGAAGIGAIDAGDSFISLGTSAQYFVARDRYHLTSEPTIHSFAHCLENRWYDMAALLNGANSLEWICKLLRIDVTSALATLAKSMRRPSNVLFLPYLAGERTPHNDPDLRAMFLGFTHAHGASDLIQAVLEGVALSLTDVSARLERTAQSEAPLPVVGGGARSFLWLQILADTLGRDLILYAGSDAAPPIGAARLACLALRREPIATVCARPKISRRIHHRPAWHQTYAASLERFRRSFPMLSLYTALPSSPGLTR
jgi:xylulokinase